MTYSVFSSQRDLLSELAKLHLPEPRFDLDPTFGRGVLHRGLRPPKQKFDISPSPRSGALPADAASLPCSSESVRSIIFDPPFLAGGGKSGAMHKRYGSFRTVLELYDFYWVALLELRRVLSKGGVLVFKCQDINNGRTQGWSHCEIYNIARILGFYVLDLFVLVNSNPMKPFNMKRQDHARKAHCYFWVLKKCEKKNYSLLEMRENAKV